MFVGGDVTSSFGFQVEGLYSQRGAKDNSEGSETKLRVTYIDVPVLARFGTSSASGMRFHVFTGPQASFLLSAEARNDDLDLTIDLKDEVESFDLGWTLGAGLEANRFLVDARYTMGLKNMSKDADNDIKNRTFTVMVGFRIK